MIDDVGGAANMKKKEFIIRIKNGLHARPAAELVKGLKSFVSTIELYTNSNKYNPKSIVRLMTANIKEGQLIQVMVKGEDEDELMQWLDEFFAKSK